MVTEKKKKKKEILTPKFVHENYYVVKYAQNPKNFVKNIYGVNNFLKNYLYKRFEVFKHVTYVNSDIFERMTIWYFRSNIPTSKDFRYRYFAHLYFLFYIKIYKSYRQLLGLPSRGQRTWSNANTPQRCNVDLRRIFAAKAWQTYPFLTKTYSTTAALAELSNNLWKSNWLYAWRDARVAMLEAKKRNVIKIDLYAMSKFYNRVELGEYKISKKTKQKKKLEKKTSFTTGLEPGFAKIYLVKSARELRHMMLQFYYTKTTRMIIEKDPKKSKKKKGGIKMMKGVKSVAVARKKQKQKKKSVWD